jgi:hypothetical protein
MTRLAAAGFLIVMSLELFRADLKIGGTVD